VYGLRQARKLRKVSDHLIAPTSHETIMGPEDHLCLHDPRWQPEKPYSMLFACTVGVSHQASTLINMEKVLQSHFATTTYSVWTKIKEQGYVETENEIKTIINDFDIFLLNCGKPVFDFDFYKRLKEINPRLLIVYLDGDSHMNFPTYTQWFIDDLDLFVSFDSIDVSDFVAQLGCRSICLGNVISKHDFYPIDRIKKDIDVSFYGGPKKERKDFLTFLGRQNVGLQCFGDSFGGVRLSQTELNQVINRSKIGLAFNKYGYVDDKIRMPRNFILSRAITGHNFEYILCRTFVLAESIDNFDRFFSEGREIVTFDGKSDLLDKIRYYLEHETEREQIAHAAFEKTMVHFEGARQLEKMANLIVKCTNVKHGYQEHFTCDRTGYRIKSLAAQGDYKPTKKHFVNLQTSLAFHFLKKGSLYLAIQQLRCLKYGFPYLFVRTQMKFLLFGLLGRARNKIFRVWRSILGIPARN